VAAADNKKPPGMPAVLWGLLCRLFDYAFASPAAERCENPKYVKWKAA
jgi:hypothetical protein